MGIEDESFATLMGSVSTEIRMKNFEKQKTLRWLPIHRFNV